MQSPSRHIRPEDWHALFVDSQWVPHEAFRRIVEVAKQIPEARADLVSAYARAAKEGDSAQTVTWLGLILGEGQVREGCGTLVGHLLSDPVEPYQRVIMWALTRVGGASTMAAMARFTDPLSGDKRVLLYRVMAGSVAGAGDTTRAALRAFCRRQLDRELSDPQQPAASAGRDPVAAVCEVLALMQDPGVPAVVDRLFHEYHRLAPLKRWCLMQFHRSPERSWRRLYAPGSWQGMCREDGEDASADCPEPARRPDRLLLFDCGDVEEAFESLYSEFRDSPRRRRLDEAALDEAAFALHAFVDYAFYALGIDPRSPSVNDIGRLVAVLAERIPPDPELRRRVLAVLEQFLLFLEDAQYVDRAAPLIEQLQTSSPVFLSID